MYPHSVAAAAKSLYESATKAVTQVSTEVEAIFNTFKSSSDDLKVLQQLPQSIGNFLNAFLDFSLHLVFLSFFFLFNPFLEFSLICSLYN